MFNAIWPNMFIFEHSKLNFMCSKPEYDSLILGFKGPDAT